MPRFLFRGAFVRFADLRYDEKSKTTYLKINFTSDFSDVIRKAMEWGEPPAGFGASDLDGEYVATHLILTPNGKAQDAQEMQISARDIGDFSFHRVKSDDGESTTNELRFQVVTADPEAALKLRDEAALKLREYLAVVGKGKAVLKVNYEAQSELEMEAEKTDEPDERLISEAQAEDTAREDGATVAPAATMGGTHQRSTRGPRANREKVN